MRRGIATGARFAAGLGLGAVAARAAYAALTRRPPGLNGLPGEEVWGRTNHRGEPVTLLEGPAVVAGAAAAGLVAPGVPGRMRAAALLAGAAPASSAAMTTSPAPARPAASRATWPPSPAAR